MKKILLLLILCLTIGSRESRAQNSETLWYERPAQIWLEALPLGNSRMGAMIYGGTDSEQIQLNEETFWSGGPHNNNSKTALQYLPEVRQLILDGKEKEAEILLDREFLCGPHGMRFLTLGNLKMEFAGIDTTAIKDYRRELKLQSATNTQTFVHKGVTYTRESFASYPDGIIVMRMKASKKGKISFQMSHECGLASSTKVEGNSLVATIPGVAHEGIDPKLTAICRTDIVTDGKVSSVGDSAIMVKNATDVVLYICAATNYVNYHDVSGDPVAKINNLLSKAEGLTYDELKNRHVASYSELYKRNSLRLEAKGGTSANTYLPTDKRLAQFRKTESSDNPDLGLVSLLYNYGRYLLISASRGKDGQPANLQGVWNDKVRAPWDSKYTININAEMNYWPAEVCNLSETADPLFSMLEDLHVTGAETARTLYGCRGWVAHHNTDLWRICGPVDQAVYGIFPNGGAWLTTHLWQHYLYTLDQDFLRQYYPVIRDAAVFYLDYMVEHNGELLVVPSASPEHGGKGMSSCITAGCTMDNQIARDALSQALYAARVLNVDPALQDTLSLALLKLPPMKIGQYGQLQEWRDDLDDPKDQHRHISHLYGLYPSNQISPFRNPELHKAAGVTLQQRGDAATGWSLGWKTNFWARMMDGNHAFRIICNMLRLLPSEEVAKDYRDGRTFPNMFDAHPPFQIDGNYGVTAGIAEMLMQSDMDENLHPCITVLPALPDAWWSGTVSGLKARGAYEVDLAWQKGELKQIIIQPSAASPKILTLRTPCKLKGYKENKTYPEWGFYEYDIRLDQSKNNTSGDQTPKPLVIRL